jgi:hypothetical protein
MIDIRKEAKKYCQSPKFESEFGHGMSQVNEAYIAGATTSKYVQAKAIQAQIDVLKSMGTIHDETCMSQRVTNKIKELQQQLKQLENEYNIRNSS